MSETKQQLTGSNLIWAVNAMGHSLRVAWWKDPALDLVRYEADYAPLGGGARKTATIYVSQEVAVASRKPEEVYAAAVNKLLRHLVPEKVLADAGKVANYLDTHDTIPVELVGGPHDGYRPSNLVTLDKDGWPPPRIYTPGAPMSAMSEPARSPDGKPLVVADAVVPVNTYRRGHLHPSSMAWHYRWVKP